MDEAWPPWPRQLGEVAIVVVRDKIVENSTMAEGTELFKFAWYPFRICMPCVLFDSLIVGEKLCSVG